MKKGLYVTEAHKDEDALGQFRDAGLESASISIFYFRRKDEDKLIERIKNNRPEVIILDSRINFDTLSNLYDRINNITGIYDIYTRVYAMNKIVNLPGIINIDLESIVHILNNS